MTEGLTKEAVRAAIQVMSIEGWPQNEQADMIARACNKPAWGRGPSFPGTTPADVTPILVEIEKEGQS